MRQAVELGNVEVFPRSKVNKDFLGHMKGGKRLLQLSNRFTCMALILSKIKEIEERTHSFEYA